MVDGFESDDLFQLSGEVTKIGRFLDNAKTFDFITFLVDGCDGIGHVLHVHRGVHASRDGEPNQFELRINHSARLGISMCEHQTTNFHGTDPCFSVESYDQRLARKLVLWDMENC